MAVNGLNFFLSHHRIESVEGVADPPQICARLWTSHDDHLARILKFAQRVETSCQLSPAEVEASDGQKILIRYGSYGVILYIYLYIFEKNVSITFIEYFSS